MAEADALRMTAEVVDKFSGPLKNLQSMLRGIGSGAKTNQLKQEFDRLGGSVAKVGNEVKNVLTPALAGIGLAGLSVSGAILGVGAALRAFSGNTAQLSLMSREVGLSAQRLREFGALGSHFGLDPGAMQGAARAFAQNMRDIRVGAGDTLGWLLSQGRNAQQRAIFQGFALDLKSTKSNEEALAKTLDFLKKIPDAVERGMLAQRLLGSNALGIIGTEDWRRVIEESRKDLGTLGPEAEKNALAFERNFGRIRNQLIGLRDAIAADVMPEVNGLLTSVRDFFVANRGEIKDGIIGFLRDLRSYDWKGTFTSIKDGISGINSGVQSVGGWKTIIAVLLGIKALKLGLELKAVAGAMLELGTAADVVMTGGALAKVLGLLTTPLAAGSVGLALATIFGMKVAGDHRKKSIYNETEDELANAKQRSSEFEKNAAGRNDDVVRNRRELFKDQIQKLEQKLEELRKQGFDKDAEARPKPGDKLDKEDVQEGTKKGMLDAFREWMFSKTAYDGAEGKYGGAKMQQASYGGATLGGRSIEAPGDGRSPGFGGGRQRMPSPRDLQRAPGIPETRDALGTSGEGGVHKGGTRGAASRQFMMRAAMDQLRREGVPEANLRAAAAHLVGQAQMESGLDPNKVHDGGTGFGIYGARDPRAGGKQRRTRMLQWLAANGYARNSAEGQMRYMAHEAMTDRDYARTKRVLMNANPSTFDRDTDTVTGNFEAPKVVNRRSGAVAGAYRAGPAPEQTAGSGGLRGQWPGMWKGKSAGAGEHPAWGGGLDAFKGAYERRGQLLDRARDSGVMGGGVEANGSVHIRMDVPKGTRATSSTSGDLFKDVSLSRGASMPLSEDV